MKNLTFIGLMLLLCLRIDAQQIEMIKNLSISTCCPTVSPRVTTDANTNQSLVIWPSTENSWITDTCWVEAPISKDFDKLFKRSTELGDEFVLLYWMLTEEDSATILHCFFTMPAEEVTNLWLASEETAIVDMETGIQYRARRTVPDCMGKHFGVKAPTGSALDFKIYFPRLPETVKQVSIYGVPVWNMRGTIVALNSTRNDRKILGEYDSIPQFRIPNLVQPATKYDKDNHKTWAVYNDAHLIKPCYENAMALWRTPEATYLAVAHEQNWMREYFSLPAGTKLIDNKGHQYKLKELKGLITKENFWIEGYSGDYIAFLEVFEPLPINVTTISYIVPEGEKYDMWGANWDGKVITNLNVNDLRKNQSMFDYAPRIIIE